MMCYPSIDSLVKKVDSKYTLVTLAALRARPATHPRHRYPSDGRGRARPPRRHALSLKPRWALEARGGP